VPVEAFLETYPVLVVAPLSAIMFISARQDYMSKGSISPFNFSLWLGVLVPLGWAFTVTGRPWQLASMAAVLVVYCGFSLKQFLPPKRPRPQSEKT
jgi:hypothetical protein